MNLIAVAALLIPAMQADEAVELRAVWLNSWSFDSVAKRERLVKSVRRANLNTVFLAVPPIVGNFGYSKPRDFEAMLKALRGISVHGWLLNHHRKGWGKPVDFTDAEERGAQKEWALAIMKAYPSLDGIHLDYIRYPEWGSPDGAKMSGITETIRMTRESIKDKVLTCTSFVAASANYEGSGAWEGAVPAWYRTWYGEHPDNWFVRRRKEREDLRDTWRLGPSFFHYQQDPRTWFEKAGLDGLFPMQYTSKDRTWKDELALWKSFLGERAERVYLGLGWLTEKGQPDWKHDADALVRFIEFGRKAGVKGFAIFTLGIPGVDDESLISALSGEGPFGRPARSPLEK